MVKHQRRSHQRGIHSSELDDCTSDSGSEDSPTTPKSNGMSWPPPGVPMIGANGHVLHRAASFADFGQHMNGYGMPQQYAHRHSLSSGAGAHEYHGLPSCSEVPPMHPHDQVQQQHAQQQQQHPGVPMLQRTPGIPQHPYYVTEQNNPGVATMNTSPHPSQAPMQQQQQQPTHYHHQVPRQGVERLPLEIPYAGPPGLNGSMQSSPSTFSAASSRSPNTQDGFYTHAPAAQAATYALHAASPVDQQPPPPQMVPYQPQMQAQQMSQPPPPGPQQVVHHQHQQQQQQQPPPQPQQQQQHAQSPHQYQPPQAVHPEEHGWYAAAVPYQSPVEVTAIHQIPTYGAGVYDPWGTKVEYDDPTMQMPSARIETM